MTELLVLDLVDRNLVTNQIVLTVGYDIDNLTSKNIDYKGEVTIDRYGRSVPKHAHGTINLDHKTSSNKIIGAAVMELYDRIIDNRLLTRRINVTANNVVNEEQAEKENNFEQIDLFTNYQELEIKQENKNYNEQIVMQSGLKIEIKEIIEITGEVFKNINF